MTKSKICRTASSILAAAVYEMFPDVSLLGGGETSYGFFYDFKFPHSVHPELHHQIEERMRQIAREKREIRSMEMVGSSAREFLKSKGHKTRALQVSGNGLFSLVEIGAFVDLSLGDLLKNSMELACFKLFEPESLGEGCLRISGTAHASKEELKNFLKNYSQYAKRRHEALGASRFLWREVEGGLLWLSRGIAERNQLIARCKEVLSLGGEEISFPGKDLLDSRKELPSIETVFEVEKVFFDPTEDLGLFLPKEAFVFRLATPFKNRISCLQSIQKMLNILGFNYRICFVRSLKDRQVDKKAEKVLEEGLAELGWSFQETQEKGAIPQLDFLVKDGLGREWASISLQARECLDMQVIVERNLALLLEI